MPPRFLPQHLLLLAALAFVQTASNNKASMDQPGAGIDAQKRELERQQQERNTIKRTPEQERQYREQLEMNSPEHTGAILLHATDAVAVAPAAVAEPAWAAAGRSWARAVTADAVPSVITVPEQPLPAAFWWGVGRGAGEAWGPVATAPSPTGTVDVEAFSAGYAEGLACCWLGAAEPPALTPR